MKRLLFAIALTSSVMAVSAQNAETAGKEVFSPHWTMQVQGGVGYTVGETSFGNLISPSAAIYAGYKFSPLWGLRAGISGWQSKGAWVTPAYEYKYNYLQGNVDVTLDLGNLFGGYKPGRIVNPYLFAGIGVNGAFNNDEAVEWNNQGYDMHYIWDDSKIFAAGRFGLGADFKVSRCVSINLEANANILSDKYNSKKADNVDWQCNLVAGLTFNFGGKKKEKPVVEEVLSQTMRPVEEKKTEEVKRQEPVRENKPVKVEPHKENVFFNIDSYKIKNEEMSKIEKLVQYMKQNPESTVTVDGYADAKTGKKNYNKELSRKRAETVASILKEKGISESRIKVTYKGDTVQPFSVNAENRVVICIAE